MPTISNPLVFLSLGLLLLAETAHGTSTSSSAKVYTRYADSSCLSTPTQLAFHASSSTSSTSCTENSTCASAAAASTSYYVKQSCSSDIATTTHSLFGTSSPYILMQVYEADTDCGTLVSGVAFLADGKCVVTDNGDSSVKATVNSDGSASIATYDGTSCSGVATKSNAITSAAITDKTCVSSLFTFSTSDVATTTTSPTTTTSTPTPTTSVANQLSPMSSLLFTAAVVAAFAT